MQSLSKISVQLSSRWHRMTIVISRPLLVAFGVCLPPALSAQSAAPPYVYQASASDPQAALPEQSAHSRSSTAPGGASLMPATPYLSATINERVEPSRANRWSAFGGAANRAEQITAIRSAYGAGQSALTYRLGAAVDAEFNDNVFLTKNNKESDIILRPQLRLVALWNMSELNTLTLEVIGGYDYYLENSDLRNFFLESAFSPASRADLQVFVGDFVITVYDEFSFSASPFQIVNDEGKQIADGEYARFTNNLGADVLWDLNDLVLGLGINHYNFFAIGDDVEQLQRTTDQLSASAKLKVGPSIQAGVEFSAAITDYDENFQNDGDGGNLGAFVEWGLTDATRLRVAGGFQGLDFDTGGTNGDEEDYDDYYFNILISNRLNQFINHSLELGHEATLGLNTNFIAQDYIRYSADLDVVRNVTVALKVGYSQNDESRGIFEDDHNLLFASVSARYRLGENLELVGGYTYNNRDSDREGFGYDQNVFRLSLRYNY